MFGGAGGPQPTPEPAFHWPWRVLGPLMDRAIAEVGMDKAERRVLSLANPAYGRDDYFRATTNLNAGLQILMPGESARPHRHSMDALRFVVEGEGAATIVDGKRCEMERGDLILTPAWTWHEHEHKGAKRVIWLDSLDVPLVMDLDATFFEPGPAKDFPKLPADAAFTAPGSSRPIRSPPRIRRSSAIPGARRAPRSPRRPPAKTARASCATSTRRPAARYCHGSIATCSD